MILPHFFKQTKPTKDMNKNGKPKQAVLFIMRVSLLQFFLVVSYISYAIPGKVAGQEILDKKVSLNLPSKEIRTVLKAIAASTETGFTYSNEVLKNRQKITVIANDERLGDLLPRILGPLHISFEVIGHQIVLKKNPAAINPTASLGATPPFRPITGTVTGADGTPLPGVSVTISGTTHGTTTDAKGYFSIEVKDGDILVFSSVGYDIYKVTVGATSNLSVTMKKSESQMGEVVVTALGIKREARSLGVSNQQVSGTDVIKADPPNISEGLIGKAAGLNVTVPNGVEGSSTRIVIRGNNSLLGNNQPLIVVDGVMVDNEPILPGGQSITTQNLLGQNTDVSQNQSTDYGSFLNTINPDDIESFSILKGPTAAALYGARGANGVILITTKKGGKEKGLGLTYNFSDRWNQPYRFIKLQDEYGSGMTETLYSANPAFYTTSGGAPREFTENDQYGPHVNVPGIPNSNGAFYNIIGFPGDGASWGPKMTGQPITWWDGTTRPYTGNPNVFKSFYRTGNTSVHNVSFSGGGDVGTLRASYTRTSNDGITYNSNYTQNVFNLGSSINVSKQVKVEATASYTNLSRLNAPNIYGEVGSAGALGTGVGYITTYGLPADYKPIERGLTFNKDGSQNTNVVSNDPYPSMGMQYYWWNTLANNTVFTQDQLLGNIKLTADILPWLNATGHVGVDHFTNQFVTKNKPTDAAGIMGSYSNDLSTTNIVNLDGMLNAHKQDLFKDIDASFTLGASYYRYQMYDLAAKNPGPFSYPFTYNLSNYNSPNPFPLPTENRSESEINSTYGLLDLTWHKYLYLEVSGRNDWSSTLPASKWSFFYPAANLSFVFTDAFNLGNARNWLSYGKVRIAEAASANGYIPYQTIYTYSPPGTNGFTSGLTVPSILPSLFIQPQRSRSFETGADLGFFNNRLNVNFTYYDIYSYNQILPVNIATSSGADELTINTGALDNRGIEFILTAKVLTHKNFSWDIAVNGAHNSNKVVALEAGVTQLPIGSWFGGDGVNMNAHVGDQYGTIYGYDYLRVNGQKVVNLLYSDGPNTGNGAVIGEQYATTPTIVKIGNATPTLTGGISNTFNYKNFSLYVLTDFKLGGQIWSGDYATFMGQGQAPETTRERDGHGLPFTFPDGTSSNSGVILPGVTANGDKPNTAVVNAWWKYAANYQSWDNLPIVRSNAIFTNSWGKLREVALTYRLPAKAVQKMVIFQNFSVSLIGRDLFYLFTRLPDRLNPEGVTGTTNVQGMQFGELPGVRSFGFSVKAGF
jgi:iron complex outermembrane receptor protein